MTTQDRVNGGRPGDVPEDVWAKADAVWNECALIVDDAKCNEILARAILAERTRCVTIARRHAAGRMSQSAKAKSSGLKQEARDFESMALSGDQIAFDLLGGGA